MTKKDERVSGGEWKGLARELALAHGWNEGGEAWDYFVPKTEAVLAERLGPLLEAARQAGEMHKECTDTVNCPCARLRAELTKLKGE